MISFEGFDYILLLLVVLINLFWYSTKMICKKKGYQISLMLHHQWDLKNMIDIIKKEEIVAYKVIYLILYFSLILSLMILILLIFII